MSRRPFTPGEILKEEFLEAYELTQAELAEKIGVHRRRINEIINNKRAITPDTALRLGKYFKMSAAYWLNLQMKVDLWDAEHDEKFLKEIKSIKPLQIIHHNG